MAVPPTASHDSQKYLRERERERESYIDSFDRVVTHSFSEGGQLLSLCPAEDVETVDEGREEKEIWDEEGGENVPLTAHAVEHATVRPVYGRDVDLWRGRER